MDIDADEVALAGSAQGQRGRGVITQDIKTNRQLHLFANGAASGGHCRDRFRADPSFREWDIAKVLDEERVGAAALIGTRIDYG